VEEVYEITETVEQLRAKLRDMENALQQLLRTKMSLEHDLTVKNNSIYIDREVCLGKRKIFPRPYRQEQQHLHRPRGLPWQEKELPTLSQRRLLTAS